jgi:hypothetical protein
MKSTGHLAIYAVTIFASAFLLFAVQPMVGKAMLPTLGGAPGAWTACLFFFQAALLAGYGYVWLGASVLSPRVRVVVHLAIASLPLWALVPFAHLGGVGGVSPASSPAAWAIAFATLNVGAPFVVLSATGPLLSHWFALTSERRPYFLYAASNAGSLGALLAYPFAIEPWLGLDAQAGAFRAAYAIVALAIAAAGAYVLAAKREAKTTVAEHAAPIAWRTRAKWAGLAFVPTMLLAGSSSHISLDLAPVPLLWVVPLAIYLASFVVAFSERVPAPPPWVGRGACLVAVVLVFVTITHANEPVWLLAALHLAFLAAGSWIAHRRLADSAPSAAHVPQFYTWIALGGVLGTLVSGVVAPHVLPDLWEYPAAIAVACAVRAVEGVVREDRPLKTDLPHIAIAFALVIVSSFLAPHLGLDEPQLAALASFGPAAIYAYRWMPLRRRYTLCLLAVVLAGAVLPERGERRLIERSFFGVLRIVDQPAIGERHLLHGTTLHGTQALSERGACVPRAYYDREGPLGWAFDAQRARGREGRTLAIGLGTGSIACYAAPHEPWRFVEINPDVIAVARDPRWFTYLRESPSDRIDVTLGDGRIVLGEEADRSLSVIVVDAFNSDAVPVHLLTREAIALYLAKLEGGGWAMLHLSNRVLDLRAVLADVVRAEHAAARIAESEHASWVVIARREEDLEDLDSRWAPLPRGDAGRAWTDDYSSLWGAFGAR